MLSPDITTGALAARSVMEAEFSSRKAFANYRSNTIIKDIIAPVAATTTKNAKANRLAAAVSEGLAKFRTIMCRSFS